MAAVNQQLMRSLIFHIGGRACRQGRPIRSIAGRAQRAPQRSLSAQGDSVLQSPPVASFNAEDWAAAFSSQPGEFDYWIEEVEGTIPEYLNGTLFRNGPGNFGEPPSPIDPAIPTP